VADPPGKYVIIDRSTIETIKKREDEGT